MRQWNSQAQRLQLAVLLVMVFVAGFAFGNWSSISRAQQREANVAIGDTDQAFQPFYEVYDLIRNRFVDSADVTVPDLVDGAISGMVGALGDRFSNYMDPSQFRIHQESMGGDVEGIGVVIRTIEATGEIEVVSLIRGAAAEAAGVLPGDIFWEVDGRSVQGISQDELVPLVRGPAGTQVTITFKRGDSFVTFTMTRVRFTRPIIEYRVLDNDIAYLYLGQFLTNAPQQMRAALQEMDVNNRKGLIFDLRGNPGGYLNTAVEVGSMFIKDGVILYEALGNGQEEIFNAQGGFLDVRVPIVVLVDESSASASELIAGAMKDRGVAWLIGETTFGKGTVQTVQPLSNGGALRLTIARWLTPNRNWIHDFGVTPDQIVEYDPERGLIQDGSEIDPQIQAAIDYILSLGQK
ncbi:MAG: S41 family peptidase [Anaerolineae bacterium]|nr:S41 family peptidase [Anaerolineae bacterium]MDW8173226.1 S41 family peptidase [Anaerolineae bacterium]